MRGIRCVAICVAITFLFPASVLAAPAQSGKAFLPPVDGEITKPFKMLKNSFGPGSHRGIDFGVLSETPVKASGAGEVTFVGPVAGEGPFITISHEKGLETTYSFLSSTDVVKGQRVSQGDVIGKSGEGHPGEGAPALHFGAKKDGKYIDPEMLFQDFSDITELIRMVQLEEQSSGSTRLKAPGDSGGDDSGSGGGGAGGSGGGGRLKAPAGLGPVADLIPVPNVVVEPAGVFARPWHWTGPKFDQPIEQAKLPQSPVPLPPLGDRLRIPTSRDPRVVAEWWSGLSSEEKERLINGHPREIGKLPGVDTVSRDKANRIALRKETAEIIRQRENVMSELERVVGNPPVRSRVRSSNSRAAKRLFQELSLLNKRFAGANRLGKELETVADSTNDGLEPGQVYLLDFDTRFASGDGKGVVALGNPDFAKHVGIVVPGLGSRLEYIDRPLDNAANLRADIFNRVDEGAARDTATIAWLGYDAPDTLPDADDPWEAIAGATALKQFVRDLRATYSEPDELGAAGQRERQHITILGHSYGSAVTGYAGKFDVDAQDLALLASPGSGAKSAKDLGAPTRRIWAARTKDDPIKWSLFVTRLGTDPTNLEFGARRIPLDDGQHEHSAAAYFQPESTGLQNFARITSGHYEEVAGAHEK